MDVFNNNIKFAKLKHKSKVKYNNIIKSSKEAFPTFLSTRHFYKRRNTFINIANFSNQNINYDKIAPDLLFSKINKKNLDKPLKNHKKHNSLSSVENEIHFLDNNKNINNYNLFINTKNEYEKNDNSIKQTNNTLTLTDKLRLKSILKNFEEHKLTTNSLYNLEKKYPLNSITESNYRFLFSDYKDKKQKYKKDLNKSININKNNNISKSSLISLNMMKTFNDRTNKILEAAKIEGTKYSNNINEFRKQIINSYKDSIVLKDLIKRKINYDNAIKLLESKKEKRIQKALELEKEFYKNKNSENIQTLYDKRNSVEEPKKRKSKKPPTTVSKKLNEKLKLLSPQIRQGNKNRLNKYSFNSLSIIKLKDIHNNKNNNTNNNTNNTNNNSNNNISHLFNKTQTNKIYDNNNLFQSKISKSHKNTNKKKLSDKSLSNSKRKNKDNKENKSNNKNYNDIYANNIYLNYINSTKSKKYTHKTIDKTERLLLDSKENYKKFIKNVIKERSKQFADSFAEINSYFEYQPLIDMNSDMPHLNINTTNLKRVIKVNNIKKNLYSLDDDDLLTQNVKKLKDKVREAEMEFYTVDGHKKRYNLSFVKNAVRPQTIAKLNHMKNPHFGIPC